MVKNRCRDDVQRSSDVDGKSNEDENETKSNDTFAPIITLNAMSPNPNIHSPHRCQLSRSVKCHTPHTPLPSQYSSPTYLLPPVTPHPLSSTNSSPDHQASHPLKKQPPTTKATLAQSYIQKKHRHLNPKLAKKSKKQNQKPTKNHNGTPSSKMEEAKRQISHRI